MSFKHLINRVANVLYVNFRYSAYLKFQFKPNNDIRLCREKKLKTILKIAVNKVPFYKPYKSEIDFNNFSLKELNKLPIVEKQDIQNDINRFLREDVNPSKLRWKATSGSSGKPFQVPKSYFSDAIEVLLGYRAWSMGRFLYKLREPAIVLRSFSPKENEPIYRRDRVRNFWYISPYHINENYLEEFLNIFKKSKAKILKGYPSSIYILTLLLKKHKVDKPKIQTIITSSESMLSKYRNEIENYWNCDVLDWYGQNERTVTVQQCQYGNYHNNDEYGICEVDEENNIIATSLNNDIMPLLRYKTNDKAIPLDDVERQSLCKCGRSLSIPFRGIEGRSDDIIYKEGKHPIPPINIYNLMEKFQEVKQFYILQESDLSVKMIVTESKPISSESLSRLKTGIRQRIGNLPLEVDVVKEIKRNKKTDKIKIIESRVN